MDCMYMWSKDKHMHCVCGGNTEFNGHDTHTNVEWTKWNSANSLPTASGNYYLANDINLDTTQDVSNDINICLNGKTIKSNTSAYAIKVKNNASLTITDCLDSGKLECSIKNYGSFNMYAGTLQNGYNLRTEPDSKMALSGNSKFIGDVISKGNAETNFSSLFPRPKALDIPCPAMAPSWIDGPSLPRERPPSIHKKPPANFAGSTRFQFWESLPAISPST